MGKKRIKVIDGSKPGAKAKKPSESDKRKLVKTGKEHGRITDMGAEALAEAERIKEKEGELAKSSADAAKPAPAAVAKKKPRPAKKRGKKYLAAKAKVDRTKLYLLPKAVKLAKETAVTQFNGNIEVHLNVKETGLKGEVKFPHSVAKGQRIRVADEKLIGQLEKGKIDFDLLIATPAMMPKLVKFAKLLGPKGLMPNPKAGTITDEPKKLVKERAGKVQFRTETKAPLIHIIIGKVDAKETDLTENFQALIAAVGPQNIQKAVITSTMGPGIKIDLNSL